MKIDILTLFPEMFKGVFEESMIKIAKEKSLVKIDIHNLRQWTSDKHKTADDKPYGGGPGMVMKVEPVDKALEELTKSVKTKPIVVLLTPQGQRFSQTEAKTFAEYAHIILVCGHYEGFDERIRKLVNAEFSIGDYILTCGEIPAMVFCDAIIRLIPGVLGDANCLIDESFENNILEYPQYTRPADYKGMKVPEVLLCGDPKKINAWQKEQATIRTKIRRPDLLDNNDSCKKQEEK
ncbi:MAG: tRNA (guanosine(37)-N1)-methyltransferase TrmD [Candidatus Omnitrophica bacterium]|nr:tRNA (guanosine(37)-N1)-methyltransferase TrmD [Candidatus Omnitrophota bacterium]MBU1894981.1 tRNA (guanosine(37)-N1)-methyltransferase TrmD [Candidatus Omnitrophota bacterium]